MWRTVTQIGRIGLAAAALLGCQKPEQRATGETGDTVAGCANCAWQLLGVHPQASMQQTATGKALVTLCPWKGRLYVGYGDYQKNTGPIEVTAWDPDLNRFMSIHSSDTEAIYNYRVIGNALYAPATDRREHADYAVGEPWRDEQPVTVAHAYDMATLDGTDLWLVGSIEGSGYLATAWRSTDGGRHWTIAHQSTGSGRYYFAGVYQHRLYLEDWWQTPRGPSEVFDGTSWSAGPELLPTGGHGFRPIVFANRLVYATKEPFDTPHLALARTPNKLLAFDGAAASLAFDRELLDFFGDEHDLLVLDTDGVIWRTRDLADWTRDVVATSLHPRSLAVLDGVLYLGTTDSKLYRLAGRP